MTVRPKSSGRTRHRIARCKELASEGLECKVDGERSACGHRSSHIRRHVFKESVRNPSILTAKCSVEMPDSEQLLDRTPWIESKDTRRCEPSQDVRAKIGIGEITQHDQDVVHALSVPARPFGEARPYRQR